MRCTHVGALLLALPNFGLSFTPLNHPARIAWGSSHHLLLRRNQKVVQLKMATSPDASVDAQAMEIIAELKAGTKTM